MTSGIEYIVSKEEEKEQKEILLVYDNVENIQTNSIDFLLHIKEILKYSSKLKLIIVQRTKKENKEVFKDISIQAKVYQMQLRQLSNHNSIKLIKFYCLRKLTKEEFESQSDTSDMMSSSDED